MNVIVPWKEEFSVNIDSFDIQHKKLVNAINMLYDSIIKNTDDDILDQKMSNLIDNTFIHFKNEEKYFALYKYEDANAHISEHQFFLKQVEKLQRDFRSYDQPLRKEIVIFLQKWFTGHIKKTDIKYSSLFIKSGLK